MTFDHAVSDGVANLRGEATGQGASPTVTCGGQ